MTRQVMEGMEGAVCCMQTSAGTAFYSVFYFILRVLSRL